MFDEDPPLSGLLRAQLMARAFADPQDGTDGDKAGAYEALDGAITRYVGLRRKHIRDQQDEAENQREEKERRELDVRERLEAEAARRPRPRELARLKLFTLCDPSVMLAPANIIAVYRRDHPVPDDAPLWPSWAWDVTANVNRRMLPFVQQLDPADPLPDDPRLALPMTIAGFWLWRALQVDRQGQPHTSPSVVMAVYDEIAQGIAAVEKSLVDACAAEPDEAFRVDFAHVMSVAQTLLFHAVRLGPELWDLILPCALGADCELGRPFYVTRPGEDNPHNRCNVEASRRKRRGLRVV